jgi:quercetin dioxygenase-like cupin family protein
MPQFIAQPTLVQAAGNKPKQIREYVGHVNTRTPGVSIAHMTSPSGWTEPGQRPEFTEYTVVLKGMLRVEHELGEPLEVGAGQGIITMPGEWVRYSTPGDDGAEYIAVCLPAFSLDTVFRDTE